jgi:ABC-type multidrug transport system fused ATPase/permease subunit
VLRDINFEVERGMMIAFVGQSGMGKSTLMDLIPRFYDPTGGSILIDGEDLRDLKNESWLRNIAIVSQDTFLFNTTIRQNILTGKPDATEQEVIEAAKAAHIWHDIEKMPDGLETKLGDRGVTLSGGQRQRVAIARAFLRKAPVLLLDEATSSLDTGSEREVQKALDGLIEGCTVFAVAHRLSTIRRADMILVLNEGRIIESGTHEALIQLGGAYANAFRLQQGEEPEPVEVGSVELDSEVGSKEA